MNYTVITATLNSEKTIQRTIDSVTSQSIKPNQYIFIDGGSSDKTIDIINQSVLESKNIKHKIIRQSNTKGIYPALNQAIKTNSSDIIFIIHSDDWYEPDAAETVIKCFENNPTADIALAPIFFHDLKKRTKKLARQKNFILFPLLMPVMHPGAFVKKRAYEKYGLYDEIYEISSDYEFFYRCYKQGAKFCDIIKPLVNMELGGIANSNRAIARKETRKIAKKYCTIPFLPDIAYFARNITGR